MTSAILAEGTVVVLRNLESRPEFNGRKAEVGQFNEKENSYECWMVDDDIEGSYVFCKPENIAGPEEQETQSTPAPETQAAAEPETKATTAPASAPTFGVAQFGVGDRVQGKDTGKVGTVVAVDADGDPKVRLDGEKEAMQRFGKEYEILERAMFGVGDRVRGKDTGKVGTVVNVDADGDPKVLIDEETEAKQRFGKEFTIIEKAIFCIGDRVRGRNAGKLGMVISVDADGDPKVRLDGESEAKQRYAKEFEIIDRAKFGVGDRVRGRDTGKVGTVLEVDADGDPKVRLDDEAEAKQRYAKEYEIIEKAAPGGGKVGKSLTLDSDASRSRSRSKKAKKKKKKASTSSSSSRKSSSSSSRKNKRPIFGMSLAEREADDKRKAKKHKKKHGKHRSAGADAALAFLGLS